MSSGPTPQAPDGAPENRGGRSWLRRILMGSSLVLVLAIVVVVAAGGYVAWRFSQIHRENLATAQAGDDDPKNYLVVGSDSRDMIDPNSPDASAFVGDDSEPAGQRSDTIMIVRVDPIEGTIDIVSFPRDLWIPIARTDGRERINTAYGFDDGPQRLIDTISQNFGIDINHYIEVDFRSFAGVVDAVDGVPMYFDTPMRDQNSGLLVEEQGCVTLDGEQALAFARARHLQYTDSKGRWVEDPSGDLGRVSRQQVFMRSLIERASNKTEGYDFKAYNDLLSSIAPNLTVDEDLETGKLLNLPKQFGEFGGDQLRTHTLPTEQFMTAGGAAVLRLDELAAQPIIDIFRGDVPAGEEGPPTSIVVQNGSGVSGQAASARVAFEALGFTVVSTGDADENVQHTVVRYSPGAVVSANEIARVLSNGAELEADPTLPDMQVVVITGGDFRVPVTVTTSTTRGSGTTAGTGTTTGPSGTAIPTTTTTEPEVVGIVPGEPPEGVTCD